jgi:cytochrome c553
MDIETLIDAYTILKQYIPQKDRQEAADNLMSVMVDSLSDQDVKELSAVDSVMGRAYKEYVGDEQDDHEYDE